MPKCKICKKVYERKSNSQVVCSYECSLEYGKKSVEKKAKEKKKQANIEKREFNKNDKTVLKRLAQITVNKYARFRDEYENGLRCCTCGKTDGKFDGGHFLPTSGYSAIRYNTNQIHLQCINCNQYNAGRYKEYKVFMIEKYGEEYVEALEATKTVHRRYTVEYYQKLIRVVKKKTKIIENRMKNSL